MSQQEWRLLAIYLRVLEGCWLKQWSSFKKGAILHFIKEETLAISQSHFLILDLTSRQTLAAILDCPKKGRLGKADSAPLALFVKSHFLGLRLLKVELQENISGLLFQFEQDKNLTFFCSYPNIYASSGGKSIFWAKPMERPPDLFFRSEEVRTVHEIFDQYKEIQENISKKSSAEDKSLKLLSRKRKRIIRAQKQIQEDLKQLKSLNWKSVAEDLVEKRHLPTEQKGKSLLDFSKSFTWNLNNCYYQHKKTKTRIEGRQKRLTELNKQLMDLQENPQKYIDVEMSRQKQIMVAKKAFKGSSSFKTILLEDGLTLIIGKNAEDNLKVLRQARPWHFWFHLKGRPCAHAILIKERTQKVPQETLRRIGRRYVEQVLHKVSDLRGQEWIVTEVRYVRALKGKTGRVTYKNEMFFVYK